MKTNFRCLVQVMLLPILLSGCASVPVQLAPSSKSMSARSAVELLERVYLASDSLNGKPSGLRIDAMRISLVVIRASDSIDVACHYNDTPDPMLDTSRMWPALMIDCRVDNKASRYPFLMAFPTKNATPAEYAKAWQVMRGLAMPEIAADRAAFATVLTDFRAGKINPNVDESVRQHKIAAELAVKEKRLWDAADEFTQGLAIAPWWPQGNFNVALVYGELRAYPLAARYMQRYLELTPDAANARAAQDKVYEWNAAQRSGG